MADHQLQRYTPKLVLQKVLKGEGIISGMKMFTSRIIAVDHDAYSVCTYCTPKSSTARCPEAQTQVPNEKRGILAAKSGILRRDEAIGIGNVRKG